MTNTNLGLTSYKTQTNTQKTTSSYSSTSSTSSTSGSSSSSSKLGQSDFLKLMVTQLTSQDPLDPMENTDFISEMAQFSTLTGIEELTDSFKTLATSVTQGQALEAASLVGKDVLAPASTATLSEGEGISGGVDLASKSDSVTVGVYDASGQLVRTVSLGGQNAGLCEFTWDGLKDDGTKAPAGTYEFRITAQTNGQTQAQTTLLSGQVNSVSYDSTTGGLVLDVEGLGKISFSDLYRIG